MTMLARARVKEGCVYIASSASTADITGPTIDCGDLDSITLTAQLTADSGSTRAGTLSYYTTDDPRAVSDPSNAAWVQRTLTAAGTDGGATVSGKTATFAAAAAVEQFSLSRHTGALGRYLKMVWDNTTAGTDGTIAVWVHGR